MRHYLLIGAGFSRNWGGPLSDEITGSLLAEFHDDGKIAHALKNGPFEDAFQGFDASAGSGQRKFQESVQALFERLNASILRRVDFEFCNDRSLSVRAFLAQFDAIFSLNQDLLLEIHYMQSFGPHPKWSGVYLPGMNEKPALGHGGPINKTMSVWHPSPPGQTTGPGFQPLFKLHGSSNWQTEEGLPMLIMGNRKTGAIDRFEVLRAYHQEFASALRGPNAKLMVIGYSFQDDHINDVIADASANYGLRTHLVDPNGRKALIDPKTANLSIRERRAIEDIRIIGETRRPLSAVFDRDRFAHGELLRFFTVG